MEYLSICLHHLWFFSSVSYNFLCTVLLSPSVQFSSFMSDSLRPHELQHARLLRSSLSPWICSNSCPLSQWCHPTISSSIAPFTVFPSIRVFSNESAFCIRWPKYWRFSFSISPSNEYSGLISFRIDWLDLLPVQDTLKSLLQHHSPKASTSIIDFMSGEFWGHQNK